MRASGTHCAPMLSTAPFRDWIESLIADERRRDDWLPPRKGIGALQPLSPVQRVAERLGVSGDRMRRWRNPRLEWIREDAVDRACCAAGVHISEIYPEYWGIAAAGGVAEYVERAA